MALEEKHALIAGSSRGIEGGIALALADSGVREGSPDYSTGYLRGWWRILDESRGPIRNTDRIVLCMRSLDLTV
jgi:hypothetical protein